MPERPVDHDDTAPLSELVRELLRTRDPAPRAARVARLRAAGPTAALAALERALGTAPRSEPARRAFDAVCAQHLAWASRLYWFTDLDDALREARATGRALISLRMLGRLDAELSCANSRLFRAVLYPDAAVSALLRERFVLHWHGVRPVPVATVDFGDGRRLVRPITGNSAHYVLDAAGRLVDVIPGLYNPRAFERALRWAATAATTSAAAPDRASALRAMHKYRLEEMLVEWTQALRGAGRAALAQRGLAALKGTRRIDAALDVLEQGCDDAAWRSLGAQRGFDVPLGAAARARAARELPDALRASQHARSKLAIESRMLFAFTHDLGEDTARNEFRLHRAVHARFVRRQWTDDGADLAAVDAWVYAFLFDTPLDDPWMGLAQPVYTALENAGLVEPPAAAVAVG